MLVATLLSKILARSKSFSFIFILNFCLAIAALSYLQFFKGSIDNSLDKEAKNLLGADIVVSSRFPIRKDQIEDIKEKLPQIKNFQEGLSTVSMVSSNKRARLMELVRINEGYPFYGGLTFRDNSKYPKGINLPKDNEVWVYKEVLDLLGIKKGSSLKIGKENFKITKIIKEDTLKTVSFSGFMPKIYMSKEALDKTELLQFGSTARYKLNYQFKDNFNNNKLEEIENTLKKSIDQNLKVLSPNDGRDRLLTVLNFITNFLSLVSLISFFLGLVGLIYLYSGFLRKHQKDIDVLNDLGVNKKIISYSYLSHLFILILSATIIVFSFILISGQFLAPILQKLIGFDFDFSFDYLFFAKSAFALLLLCLSIGTPLILPLLQRKKTKVFQNDIKLFTFYSSTFSTIALCNTK